MLKTAADSAGERHTLEVFGTLRYERDAWDDVAGDYERHRGTTHVYMAGGAGHVFYDGGQLPAPDETPATRLFINIGDHLGSATVTIDHTSSEVVERATFDAHGRIESDFRPDRWGHAREPYKFTGKEEDIEVGATYLVTPRGAFLRYNPPSRASMSGKLAGSLRFDDVLRDRKPVVLRPAVR